MWTFILLAAAMNTDCYQLRDMDQRNYCLARERNDVGQCYAITSSSLRASCRSEVQRDASICDQLLGDERQICKSRATN